MLIKTRRVTATPRPIAKAVNLWGPSVIWEPSASTKLVHFNVEVSVGQVSEVAQVVVVELGRAVVAEEDETQVPKLSGETQNVILKQCARFRKFLC